MEEEIDENFGETQEFAIPTGFPSADRRAESPLYDPTQSFDVLTQNFDPVNSETNSQPNLFPETQQFDRFETYADDSGENYLAGSTQAFDIEHVVDYQEDNRQIVINEKDNGPDDFYLSTQPFTSGGQQNEPEETVLESNMQQFDAKSDEHYENQQLEEEEFVITNEDGPASPDDIDRGVEALVEFEEEAAESSNKELEEEKIEQKTHARRIISDDEDDDERSKEKPSVSANYVERERDELRYIFGGDSDEEGAVEHGPPEGAEGSQEQEDQVSDGLEDFPGQDSIDDDKKDLPNDFKWDFDIMMQKRKEENSKRRRRRRDYDIINDADEMINELLKQMRHAAKEDVELNSQKQPASRKRKLLPSVMKELKKSDLQSAFIELGIVGILADWLTPLPDKSLPAQEIRTEILKILQQFPTLDHQILRSSCIGKAVMVLFKHPKETKENKERAGKLISEWARPIFNLQSDYRSLSKDERVKRDYDHMPMAKKRRMSSLDAETPPKPTAEEKVLGPGDKGFIGRARVPRPSTKDYVVRPKWNIETEFRRGAGKKATNAMDRKIREFKEKTKPKKLAHAIGVSIEGRKMAL